MGTGNDKRVSTAVKLRSQAEEQLKAETSEAPPSLTAHEAQSYNNELQVHQIELEIQNTELRQARDELERALGKYTALYDFAPIAYLTIDRSGDIRAVNLSGAGLLGIERSRLLGRRFALFVAAEDHLLFSEFLRKAFASRCKESCQVTLTTEGSSLLFVQIEAVAMPSGQECHLAVIDITERKRAEEAILISYEIFRAIGDSIDYGVWICTPDGRNIYASDSFLRLVGLTQEQCSNFGWGEVLHPDDAERTISAWKECIRTEGVWDIEHRFVGVDGQLHNIVARGVPVRNNSGEIINWAGINLDISSMRRTEELLQHSEQQLAEAQRLGLLGSWQWDQISGEITGSDEFYRIFGLFHPSFEGFMELVHPDDREMLKKKVKEAIDRQLPSDIYYRIVLPDETIRIIHGQGRAIIDDAGKLVRIIGTAQDVTERRRSKDELIEKQKELEKLNRSLEERIAQTVEELRQMDQMMILQERLALMGEMINNIAHQWRQPLNSLGLVIQQLQLFYDSAEFSREFLKKNTEKSMELIQFMSRTIDDFRNFFRSDKKTVTFDVNQSIVNTLSLIEKSFKDQQISFACQTEGNLMANGYPNEYSQVLLNILMNSRDALIGNNVDNALISIHAFAENGKTVVTITDNAGGISDKIIDRLFDPYFSTKGPDRGTGIGLFMSKTIIEKNMRGRLMVRNTSNGAEFRIEV